MTGGSTPQACSTSPHGTSPLPERSFTWQNEGWGSGDSDPSDCLENFWKAPLATWRHQYWSCRIPYAPREVTKLEMIHDIILYPWYLWPSTWNLKLGHGCMSILKVNKRIQRPPVVLWHRWPVRKTPTPLRSLQEKQLGSPRYSLSAEEHCWLVVDLPLWKIWVRQLGWWNSQYDGKNKSHVPNHQPDWSRLSHFYRNFPWKICKLNSNICRFNCGFHAKSVILTSISKMYHRVPSSPFQIYTWYIWCTWCARYTWYIWYTWYTQYIYIYTLCCLSFVYLLVYLTTLF